MSTLQLELFFEAGRDFEQSQYRILGALKQLRGEFAHNKVYPTLADLIEFHTTLKQVSASGRGIRDHLPRRIQRIDVDNKRIIYEPIEINAVDMEAIAELIDWALPHIQRTIDEGRTIYHFVDDNLRVEEVGLVPSRVEEGYILLPEIRRGLLHVLRYEVTIFTSSDERFRNLKTTAVRSMPLETIGMTPTALKLDLIAENRDLPNPATYLFATDIDFPFAETILPIAKRKLLRQIYS